MWSSSDVVTLRIRLLAMQDLTRVVRLVVTHAVPRAKRVSDDCRTSSNVQASDDDADPLKGGEMARKPHLAASSAIAGFVVFMALALGPLGSAPTTAYAGPPQSAVLDWNLHAVTALSNPTTQPTPPLPPIEFLGAGETPPVAATQLAMVQGAVYDAVNAIDGGHKPYLTGLPTASPKASKPAAVATAAHHVLVGLVNPTTRQLVLSQATRIWLDQTYEASLARIADSKPKEREAKLAGIAAGDAAAQEMLRIRANDGRFGSFLFTPGAQPGQWRPTATPPVSDPFAWVARVEPFFVDSSSQFRTAGPHALTGRAYAREYNEVKNYGGNGTTTPTLRSPEQVALAGFYTVNPVELFNRTFRVIAADKLRLVEQARLFAMLNMAVADSVINCWDDKAFWNFWRPITAIRLGDTDGNPNTVADAGWTSMLPAPPYPEHPSGYNCVTGAFMHTGKIFFGTDRLSFSVERVAPGAPNVTRNYERFTDVVKDTVDARVYQGIHFRAGDKQGAAIGMKVAAWLDQETTAFQPIASEEDNGQAVEGEDD
jgi:hypothetical protein